MRESRQTPFLGKRSRDQEYRSGRPILREKGYWEVDPSLTGGEWEETGTHSTRVQKTVTSKRFRVAVANLERFLGEKTSMVSGSREDAMVGSERGPSDHGWGQ